MTQPQRSRRQRIEEEIAFLEAQLVRVQRERERTPWLLCGLVLVIPAAILYSWAGAIIVIVVVCAATACALYLGVGHRLQYEDKLGRLRAELAALEPR